MYVGQHLSFALCGKATEGGPGSEPDSGNPTVRDRRGACGNVIIMGAGLRPIGKLMELPPYPKVMRAPYFYPDRNARDRLYLSPDFSLVGR